ncbi:hypothetical protein CASFOL_003135 [Castilleja foliolosa]|uniref:Sister chromatid cohesion 1 protein 1 n=1 Tax=Castilleja foliolosa TaxID=1961234 RepID=A0ABD3EJN6_9LAMI
MAATMHAKIHRRKLDKLNIIKICEEILNPSVPMALRLSGILMGGVVIVYERKVKLLYDDVNRLLVEINEAWKVKTAPADPTRLPKGKSQAKLVDESPRETRLDFYHLFLFGSARYDAVTLPPNTSNELEEIERSLPCSSATTIMDFQQTSYIAMRLDNFDDPQLHQNVQGDLNQDHHQADAANITLGDNYNLYQSDTNTFHQFERFDIQEEEGTQLNFTPPEQTEMPSLIPSPPRQEKLHNSNEIQEQHPEEQVLQQSDESKEDKPKDQMRQRVARRRAKRSTAHAMDYDQTVIPCQTYQSWLKSSSDLVRGRKRERPMDALSMMKIPALMDLPSVVLVEKLVTNGNRQIHYPTPLLEVWMRSTQPPHDSPSGRISQPQPPEPSSSSPPERIHFMEPMGDPFEDFHTRVDSMSTKISIEKQRANDNINEMIPPEILIAEIRNNLKNKGLGINGVSGSQGNLMATPVNSGDEIRSIPSSGSGHGFRSHNSEVNSGRSSKKRPFSASKNSGNSLDPVAEDLPWQHSDPNFKLARLSENGIIPDNDLLVETGPTQTQKHPIINQPLDQITDSIRMHLKTHFDTPGSSKVESINQLAYGMNRKRAACLFYQTCVLATRDYIRLEQNVPYGDILVSRGPKM